jgi:AmmeMemoRadiSam system protein B
MSVAGAFYPDNSDEILRYINHFTKAYDENFTISNIRCKAVIVPHAGYIYSGFTANVAYRVLAQSGIKNFVVIGPSHRVGFDGISMCEENSYQTPFGNLGSSSTMLQELKENFNLHQILNPHAEHSTEVQFPFLKHYISDAKIIELVYGDANTDFISEIIDFVLSKNDWGVVISTDLSHFHDLKRANILDNICVKAVEKIDPAELHNGCEACGIIGVEGMLKSAKKLNLSSTILDHRTSADASGDDSRVVGYLSACFL